MRCSKTEENEDSEDNCEAEVQGHTSNPSSLEVAAIADTDDDFLVDTLVNENKFANFELCRYSVELLEVRINLIIYLYSAGRLITRGIAKNG